MLKFDTHVYLGPTLDLKTARNYLPQAYYHAPIQCGDLIKLLRLAPKRVIIIDGVYENVPSVWHKEIMLLLDNDVDVFGAASMGALRAAELHRFGMVGLGKIFFDFVNHKLCDDDEVAVLHKGKQDNFIPINDAMVNIRATLAKATELRLISYEYAEQLITHCKHQFYPYRLLQHAITHLAPVFPQESHVLLVWISNHGMVQLKKSDAIEALTHVQLLISSSKPLNKRTTLTMPMTKFIASLVDDVESLPFDTREDWLPSNELKLQSLFATHPQHFCLLSEVTKWMKHLFLCIDDNTPRVDPKHCLNYMKQHDLYLPDTDFKSIEHHPVIGTLYPFIYSLVCLGNVSNRLINTYLPATAFYFGMDFQKARLSEKNILRKVLVLILLAHTQLQDKALKIKQQVILDHLKDRLFWKRHPENKDELHAAIDFTAIYMQITYVYQGFRDSRLGNAVTPFYFRWVYDAMALCAVDLPCEALSEESHALL